MSYMDDGPLDPPVSEPCEWHPQHEDKHCPDCEALWEMHQEDLMDEMRLEQHRGND